jgi:DNA-binding transcriptional LysR family regulator
MIVSFGSLDLNLLRVFNAVMEERSVLRASQKVNLSQSAVSHSLARLRDLLDDELFIRTASGMQPTARAMSMGPIVHQSLQSLEAMIEAPSFDPRTSRKRFTVAASDSTTMILAPTFLRLLFEPPLRVR